MVNENHNENLFLYRNNGGGEETKSRKFIRALEHDENRKIHLCMWMGLNQWM